MDKISKCVDDWYDNECNIRDIDEGVYIESLKESLREVINDEIDKLQKAGRLCCVFTDGDDSPCGYVKHNLKLSLLGWETK